MILILLFANAALFALSQLSTRRIEHAPQPITQWELHPEKIRIVEAPGTRPPDDAPANMNHEQWLSHSVETQTTLVECLEWAGVAAQDRDRSRMLLESLAATYDVVGGGNSAEGFWVHIPAIEGASAVADLVARLKAAGERDFAVSRGGAPDRYYISLGVFNSEERAKRQYERFQDIGAVITARGAKPTVYVVQVRAPGMAERIIAAASSFQGTTVKNVTCPAARA